MPVSLPNLISLGRLVMVPVVVWLLVHGNYDIAFFVFLAASLSDALDGFIAKRFDMASQLGAVLDPLADKALLVSVFIVLGQQGAVAAWLVIAIVFRDLMILGGVVVLRLFTDLMPLRPTRLSKVNTMAQFVLALALLFESGFATGFEGAIAVLVWLTAATTVSSGASYLVLWVRQMAGGGGAPAHERTPAGAAERRP